ncbi:MAG TPA: hypothetical protein ENJ95_21985, partial [Bacteroidetes bacterium]|nr:hypothetical protein [Bacteroidota bacterium]
KEILDYAGKQGIAFREDRSNTQDKYTRNLIRNRVVPLLQSVNPSFQHSAGKTIGHLREVEKLYDFAIGHFKNKLLRDGQAGRWKIPIEKLRGCPAPATVLYEILRPFGFNSDQVGQMLQSTENQPGSFFYSENYRLLADRDFFILEEKKEADHPVPVRGFKNTLTLQLPDDGMVKFKKTTSRPEAFPNNPNTAVLDAGTLQWPLLLRHWQPGDVFQPLGMEGRHKKLQDFFSDLKMSRLEKEKTWLLVSDDDIVWVMGRRISEANKVTARTVKYLVVEFLPGIFAK